MLIEIKDVIFLLRLLRSNFVKYQIHKIVLQTTLYILTIQHGANKLKNVKSHILLRTTEFTQPLFYRLVYKVLCNNRIQIL